MTSSILPGRPSRFSGVDTSLPVEELREDTMEKRVSFYGVLSANVNCMSPLAMLLQVSNALRGLNSETTSISGDIFGDF